MLIGDKFDDFLKEEGMLETTTQAARQKVLALQKTIAPSDSSPHDITPTKDNSDSIQVKFD